MPFNPFSVLTSKIFGGLALALLILVGIQSCQIDRITDQRDKAKLLAEQTQAAFDQTVADYRAAAVEAERIQQANLDRVKAERASIDERTIHDLKTARDASDARYRRLLASAAQADTSRAADPDLSAVTDAACLAYGAARCDELPAKLKAAQDNTDQLIALQAWVAGQAVISTNPAE
ncbi:hypothetical protein L7H23_01290 [Sphingopyxis sp. BSN-002]|uniref:hypothetical protein n=1 Tax=Sphingopyxis sp. BSN-002 TaxID=2911495 RepID=UPI001EDAA021|nr:hypothetical protein [Sphingopyxis sp. BSN-002]QVJ07687.1 hypothetical protein [Sphingopyxis phage VSN-002]UKK84767.1 hypothetical protein L7H23_01290 [Sphingopyxis sp. BSN-002]